MTRRRPNVAEATQQLECILRASSYANANPETEITTAEMVEIYKMARAALVALGVDVAKVTGQAIGVD
jgi:hypothetical protein